MDERRMKAIETAGRCVNLVAVGAILAYYVRFAINEAIVMIAEAIVR